MVRDRAVRYKTHFCQPCQQRFRVCLCSFQIAGLGQRSSFFPVDINKQAQAVGSHIDCFFETIALRTELWKIRAEQGKAPSSETKAIRQCFIYLQREPKPLILQEKRPPCRVCGLQIRGNSRRLRRRRPQERQAGCRWRHSQDTRRALPRRLPCTMCRRW